MTCEKCDVKIDLNNRRVKINLPFPPTLNHNVGTNGKRRYRTKEYKAFIETVGWLWKIAAMQINWPTNVRYDVTVWLAYNSRRRWDEDDRIKPLFDALTIAGAWKDDSQVVSHDVKKFQPVKFGPPRCYVAITWLVEAEPEIPEFEKF